MWTQAVGTTTIIITTTATTATTATIGEPAVTRVKHGGLCVVPRDA
jgi:hypothetical protein